MGHLWPDQKHPILMLVGPPGAGKSKLAEKASLSNNSPFHVIRWKTNRTLTQPRELQMFEHVATEGLERLRKLPDLIVSECLTPRKDTFMLLVADILAATQTRVGLLTGPSTAAKRLRNWGFRVHVIGVSSNAPGPILAENINPDTLGDSHTAVGLMLDDMYVNDFGPGGLQNGVEYVLKRGRQLLQSL